MASSLSRNIPGVGSVWASGRYVKSIYRGPALRTILLNIKRVINLDQNTIFDEIAELEGVTLPREHDDYYFNEASIHAGITPDPNKFAIWITGEETPTGRTSGNETGYLIEIFVTIGSGDFDEQVQLQTVFQKGLSNLFGSMPGQELVYDWPDQINGVTIAADSKANYQPTITIKNRYIVKPDIADGATADSLGPLSKLTIELTSTAKENR